MSRLTQLARLPEVGGAVLLILLDQVTKEWVRRAIPLHESIPVIDGFLNWVHVRNSGAAFGFMNAVDFPYKSVVVSLVAVVALVAIASYARQLGAETPLARTALTLVLAGAVGNLIDRLTAGFVVDFVDVYWREYHFWAFNVADSAITVGAILMVVELIFARTHVSPTA